MKKKIIEFTIYLFLAFFMSTLYAEWYGNFKGFLAYLGVFFGQNMYPMIAAIIISVIFYLFKRKDVFRIFMNALWGLTMLSWYLIFGNSALYIIGILLLVYIIYLYKTSKTKKLRKSELNSTPTGTFYGTLKESLNTTSEENQKTYKEHSFETQTDKGGNEEIMPMKKDLNIILSIILYLVIIRHAVGIFTTLFQLTMVSSGFLSLPILLWNLTMHIIFIIVLFNILSIKRWAVYAFGGIQVVNVAVLSLFFGRDFFASSIASTLFCLLLAALFCLKKDGVSAWRVFFPKTEKEEDDEPACIDEIESVIDEEKGVEDTFMPELSVEKMNEDNKTSKFETSSIQDDNLFKSLESLPLKEDGSIDYEQMTTIQQFAYTYKTESLEVALKDLNADIKVLEKSIAKVKKELSSLSGGNRAKLRDSLREEQAKLNELYDLRNKYTQPIDKKTLSRKNKYIFGSIIFFIILFIGSYIILANTDRKKTDNNEIIADAKEKEIVSKPLSNVEIEKEEVVSKQLSNIDTEKDLVSMLYSIISEDNSIQGDEEDFRNWISIKENAESIYNIFINNGYEYDGTKDDFFKSVGVKNRQTSSAKNQNKQDKNVKISNNIKSEEQPNVPYIETILRTGDCPYSSYFGYGGGDEQFDKKSANELIVGNYSQLDAVVILEDSYGRVIRNVYIKSKDSYSLTRLPGKPYKLKVMLGNSWNINKDNGDKNIKGGFMKNVSYLESKATFVYNSFQYRRFATAFIKLQGDEEFKKISKNTFFN